MNPVLIDPPPPIPIPPHRDCVSMMKAFTDQMASAATDRREEAKLRAEEAKLRAESAKQQSQVQQALLSFLSQQAAKK